MYKFFLLIYLKINRLKYDFFEILNYFFISPTLFYNKIKLIKKNKIVNINDSNHSKDDLPLKNLKNNTIIVIDNFIPKWDKDAGSRTLFQYLKLYKKLGFSVVFVPDSFIKEEPYTSELKKNGIDVLYGNKYKRNFERWVYNNSKYISIVLLNRPRSIKYFKIFKTLTNCRIIYYGMDIYFLREYNAYLTEKKKYFLNLSKYHKKIELKMYENADIIFTVSEKEEKYIKDITKKDNVITIPCFFYERFYNIKYEFDKRNNLLFVGGQKHSPNENAIIWYCTKIMPLINNKNIKLLIVGEYDKLFINKYQSERVVFKGCISDDELKELYLASRISIIPLRYGAGVKGKMIEALYYGMPVVSTDFGAEGINKDILDFICIANTAEDFANKIDELYNNQKELFSNSKKASVFIKQFFSYENAKKITEQILK